MCVCRLGVLTLTAEGGRKFFGLSFLCFYISNICVTSGITSELLSTEIVEVLFESLYNITVIFRQKGSALGRASQ